MYTNELYKSKEQKANMAIVCWIVMKLMTVIQLPFIQCCYDHYNLPGAKSHEETWLLRHTLWLLPQDNTALRSNAACYVCHCGTHYLQTDIHELCKKIALTLHCFIISSVTNTATSVNSSLFNTQF
jgi:hypothetical protein